MTMVITIRLTGKHGVPDWLLQERVAEAIRYLERFVEAFEVKADK